MEYKKLLANEVEIFYKNEKLTNNLSKLDYTKEDILEAESRLKRFSSYLKKVFPELEETNGIIESKVVKLDKLKEHLNLNLPMYIKLDSHLPISGSVKARGGIYEVLKFAEEIAIKEGMLSLEDDYEKLANPEFKEFFSKYKIAVGSTGNLGLSIGIISAKLGFHVTVHMSSDARQWKKDLLRSKGAIVIEYPDDYEKAVFEGRRIASEDPMCHFVDDENSLDLFMGYSVAGKRLFDQLKEMGIVIDDDNPLNVYIPCGVGGAPGGITFGIKTYFGENAKVYFIEPTKAPCMALGLATGLHNDISVKDIGLDGQTLADGLAVGRSSGLVSKIMEDILDGCLTISDDKLYPYMKALHDEENIFIEPSAAAGIHCCSTLENNKEVTKGIHLVWATGGNMVPSEEKNQYLQGKLD